MSTWVFLPLKWRMNRIVVMISLKYSLDLMILGRHMVDFVETKSRLKSFPLMTLSFLGYFGYKSRDNWIVMYVWPWIVRLKFCFYCRFKSDDTINSKGFSAAYVIIDDADNGYGDDYGNPDFLNKKPRQSNDKWWS